MGVKVTYNDDNTVSIELHIVVETASILPRFAAPS